MEKKDDRKILQKNKKAFFNYEIVETLECGIVLQSSEVKSMKEGRFSFNDSYVEIDKNGNLTLLNFQIQPYSQSSIFNHKTTAPRRLLCHRSEIKRLKRKVDEKGFSMVITEFYLKRNIIKGSLALVRGKSLVNKKNTIKERDIKRDIDREIRGKF